jgi:hypothetical protein
LQRSPVLCNARTLRSKCLHLTVAT